MLVRFDSKAGRIMMFGDVAKELLRLMGQSGEIPGAILARDIPAAVGRLREALRAAPREAGGEAPRAREEGDAKVSLSHRAFPLIELLERAAARDADVIWEEERSAV